MKNKFFKAVSSFLNNEHGQAHIEYILIGSLITVILLIGLAELIKPALKAAFDNIANRRAGLAGTGP